MTSEVAPLVGKARRSVELSDARINIFEGSVRSGKTVASLLRWLKYLRTGPPGNLLMTGRTERTLRQNVIDPLTEMLGRKRCKVVWGDGVATILGRRVYLVGANDEKSVQKIQGLTLAGAYVDEGTILPESFWSMLLTRLSVEGAQLFATCNPGSRNHWMMRRYLRRAKLHLRHDGTVHRSDGPKTLDLNRFSFNLRDNPSLPAAYVAELSKTFTGLFYQRFIEGLWVLAEGAIWDMWDQDAHMVSDLPRDRRGRVLLDSYTMAIDYGTVNPLSATLAGVGPDEDGTERIWVVGEWRWDSRAEGRQMTDAQYSAALSEWLTSPDSPLVRRLGRAIVPDHIYVDPSAASFSAQLYRDRWAGVRNADNRVDDGLRTVGSLFSIDRLRIHSSCLGQDGDQRLIDELTAYVWDPDASEKGEEKPLKVDDHGPDSLRYLTMGMRREWRHWLTHDPLTDDLAEAA